MIDTKKLKGVIVEQGKTQENVARAIGMSPRTFSYKMKKGVFGSDEIEAMIEYLKIEQPLTIFFVSE